MTEQSDIDSTGGTPSGAPAPGDPDDAALVARWRAAAGTPTPSLQALAALAEGRLDGAERVAAEAWLADRPHLQADIAAAREIARGETPIDAADEVVIARALALVPTASPAGGTTLGDGGIVLPFRSPARPAGRARTAIGDIVRWAAVAASFALVSYIGFELGSDAYVSYAELDPGTAAGLHRDILFEPPVGFFGGIGEASQT